jgi:hypothetical protein
MGLIEWNNRIIQLLLLDHQYNRMILIIQIIVPDIFIKRKLIELFKKIAYFTHCHWVLNYKKYKNFSYKKSTVSIVLLFILFLIIGIIPGIGNRQTNRFNTYKYLD